MKKPPTAHRGAEGSKKVIPGRGGVYRVLGVPDMQVPYHDELTLSACEKYWATQTYDEYLNYGDFMDFDEISSHSKGQLRKIEGKTLFHDYEVANTILDRHQKLIRKNNKKAKFTLLEGNHEFRVERYIDEHPQLKGLIEVEKGLRLKERDFRWVRCWQKGTPYRIGKSLHHHGLYVGAYHARQMVVHFGENIFYGHNHDVMSYPYTRYGPNQTIVGQSLGCLCRYDQSYIKNNPTNWQQCFVEFYFLPNGTFNYYITRIFNHQFVAANGKLYKP